MSTDSVMAEIQDAIAMLHAGDRLNACAAFETIWKKIEGEPRPLHVCVLAHFMADTQDSVRAELAWGLRAYVAASQCADVQQLDPSLSMSAFLPSLHLNLADDYFRLDELELARTHLHMATECLKTAPATPYIEMIKGSVVRLEKRLAEI
jgi:hypothetical protein